MKNSSAYAIPLAFNQATISAANNAPRIAVASPLRNVAQSLLCISIAIGISTIGAWCVASMVSLFFEWGYEAVKAVSGQPDSGQAVMAGMSLWFGVMPFAFALIFGALKRHFNGGLLWNLLPLFAVVLGTTVDLLADSDVDALLEMTPWVVLALGFAYGGFFAGQKIMRELSDEKSKQLVAAGIIACVPAGFLVANSVALSYQMQIGLTAACILTAASFIGSNAQQNTLSGRLNLVSHAMLPILFPLAINVVVCMLSFFLDTFGLGADLGWRACASAATLLTFAGLNTIVGCFAGYCLRETKQGIDITISMLAQEK